VCGSPQAQGAPAGNPGQALTPVSTNLAATNGWGQPQTLLVVIGLLMLVLVLAPPLVAYLLGQRSAVKQGSKT